MTLLHSLVSASLANSFYKLKSHLPFLIARILCLNTICGSVDIPPDPCQVSEGSWNSEAFERGKP